MNRLCYCCLALLMIVTGGFAVAAENASMEEAFSVIDDMRDAAQGLEAVKTEVPYRDVSEAFPGEDLPAVSWIFGVSMSALYARESMLVNKNNLLAADYEPLNRVKTAVKGATSASVYMERVAAEALEEMFAAAKDSGYTLYLKSGYRSYGTQKTMYTNRLQSMNGKDDGVVAPPGASEHQTGLGCDILNKDYAGRPRMTPDFSETAEARWMAENSADFGFILRYPE
ncbi:MAG: M15 family metallopeptidase, partial [Clostridia bacterium]|nr:M15 family metallopeptidase [Clostridia bacterium]